MLTPHFWVAISFVIFIAIVFKPLKKLIINNIDQRTLKITKELEEVTALKDQALKTLLEYQQKQKDIEVDLREIITITEQEIAILSKNAESEVSAYLNNRTNKIMERITAQENKIVSEFRFQAVDIASEVVRTVIKDSMTDDLSDHLIVTSLDNLYKKIH